MTIPSDAPHKAQNDAPGSPGTHWRDARLRRALNQAPDGQMAPRLETREAIFSIAQNPDYISRNGQKSSKFFWLDAATAWLSPRRPWGAAFATVLLGGLITLLWHREPLPEASAPPPAATTPAPANTPTVQVTAPAARPPAEETAAPAKPATATAAAPVEAPVPGTAATPAPAALPAKPAAPQARRATRDTSATAPATEPNAPSEASSTAPKHASAKAGQMAPKHTPASLPPTGESDARTAKITSASASAETGAAATSADGGTNTGQAVAKPSAAPVAAAPPRELRERVPAVPGQAAEASTASATGGSVAPAPTHAPTPTTRAAAAPAAAPAAAQASPRVWSTQPQANSEAGERQWGTARPAAAPAQAAGPASVAAQAPAAPTAAPGTAAARAPAAAPPAPMASPMPAPATAPTPAPAWAVDARWTVLDLYVGARLRRLPRAAATAVLQQAQWLLDQSAPMPPLAAPAQAPLMELLLQDGNAEPVAALLVWDDQLLWQRRGAAAQRASARPERVRALLQAATEAQQGAR